MHRRKHYTACLKKGAGGALLEGLGKACVAVCLVQTLTKRRGGQVTGDQEEERSSGRSAQLEHHAGPEKGAALQD